jgi:hypothetical protein
MMSWTHASLTRCTGRPVVEPGHKRSCLAAFRHKRLLSRTRNAVKQFKIWDANLKAPLTRIAEFGHRPADIARIIEGLTDSSALDRLSRRLAVHHAGLAARLPRARTADRLDWLLHDEISPLRIRSRLWALTEYPILSRAEARTLLQLSVAADLKLDQLLMAVDNDFAALSRTTLGETNDVQL